MPRIRRWFPVSHDINRDPEVWALTEKYSDKALRIWLECLSIADRNEGVVTCALDGWCRAVTFLLRTHHRRTTEVVAEFLRLGWLVLDGDQRTVRVAKFAEYHQTREKIKSHTGTKEVPPFLPNHPNHPKEEKNKEKKTPPAVSFVPPDWIPKDIWEDFCTHRKSIRAPVTPLAAERIVEQLNRLRGRGFDPAFVLNKSIANGWRGVFEPKGNEVAKPPTRPTFQPKKEDKPMTAGERENVKALLKGLVAVK